MAVLVRSVGQCSPEQLVELFAEARWPAFIGADREAAVHLPRVRATFGTFELALVEDEQVVAAGWGVPLTWTGRVADLPTGYSDSLGRALRDHDERRTPDTFVLCAIQVHRGVAGRDLARAMITALIEHAASIGLLQVIAPLRPTLKHRYPLAPIEAYASWTRADGEPLDPWLRTHARLSARILATTESSQIFTGSVAQWEQWSGLALPATGTYVVPDALAPLSVDRSVDVGRCVEPGIWVRHR